MAASLVFQDGAPAFIGVKRVLRARIGRDWQIGDRLPCVTDVARELGVSQNNAHRAIRELVDEGVLFSRRRLGTYVRRIPEDEVDQLDATVDQPIRGRQIALLRRLGLAVPMLDRMAREAEAVLRAAGGGTITHAVESDDAWRLPPGSDAVIIINPGPSLLVPPGHMPGVLLSTGDHHHPAVRSRLDVVGVDQIHGGGLAARALQEAGCGSVCFLGARLRPQTVRYHVTSNLRLAGFEMVWGQPLPAEHLLRTFGYSTVAGGAGFARYLALSPRPEGVFCATDELALGFMAAAAGAGLQPGRDFQLVGFDGQDRKLADDDKIAQAELTTVRIPAESMGRLAATMIIERLMRPSIPPRHHVLCASLSYGQSTRRVAGWVCGTGADLT